MNIRIIMNLSTASKAFLLLSILQLGGATWFGGDENETAQLEKINLASMEAFQKFQTDLTSKETELEEGRDKAGSSSIVAPVALDKSTDPQVDFNELAAYFKVLNYADIAALDFISNNCKESDASSLFDSKNDPNLCYSYQLILIKNIEGRIRTITSHYLYYDKVLKAPKEWPEHAMEALGQLERLTGKLPPENRSHYTLERVILKGMKEVSGGKTLDKSNSLPIPSTSPLAKVLQPTVQTTLKTLPNTDKQSLQTQAGPTTGEVNSTSTESQPPTVPEQPAKSENPIDPNTQNYNNSNI